MTLISENIKGKVIYLLVALILLNFLSPITELGTGSTLIFVSFYCLTLGVGVYVVAINRKHLTISVALALPTLMILIIWTLTPPRPLTAFLAYVSLVALQFWILFVLFQFVFYARRVTRDVILAAITIYLLIGDVFIPIYMGIETVTRATIAAPAFILSIAPEVAVGWQDMAYYSYVTLTTLGYGDVLPVTGWARMAAVSEAIIGVLYIAILMARLVSLFNQEKQIPTP